MTAPDWLTPSQQAAWDRGRADALAAVADARDEVEDTLDVLVDVADVIAATRDDLARFDAAADAIGADA